MTWQGQIRNGVVVLDEPGALPEGTRVQVEPVTDSAPRTLADRFRDIIGTAADLPEDFARNHDHYIHGAPKR